MTEKPWMFLCEDWGWPEEDAEKLFHRIEPLKTAEERIAIVKEMMRWNEAISVPWRMLLPSAGIKYDA